MSVTADMMLDDDLRGRVRERRAPGARRGRSPLVICDTTPLLPYCPTYYPVFVLKTTVYLDDADARLLAMLAEREGVSQALLLRKAIRAYVPQRRESRNALDGVGQDPGGAVADADAAALLKSFGG